KRIATEHFDRHAAGKVCQVELHRLREAGEIYHDENRFIFVATQERQHFWIIGEKEMKRAAREGFEIFPHRDYAAHPPEERGQILLLIFDVSRFVMILGIDDDGQMELLWIGMRKASVAIGAPLHRRSATVAIAEINVVAHADLVAVINDRRA